MSELYVDAIRVALRERPRYVPASSVPDGTDGRWLADFVARSAGISLDDLGVLAPDGPDGGEAELCLRVLGDLGSAGDEEQLYLVRSGPVLDPRVSLLPELVHVTGRQGEDLGLTHLDASGGATVFELLSWALPEDGCATVLLVDEPPVRSVAEWPVRHSVVGIRVTRRPAALRLMEAGWREEHADTEVPFSFSGPGPCDAWTALTEAIASGLVRDGDRVLLRTGASTGPRQGRLLLEATAPAAALAGTAIREGVHTP